MPLEVKITFDTKSVAAKVEGAAKRAVGIVSQTILDDCNMYAPEDQGQLINSSEELSDVMQGNLAWADPYARFLYHGLLMVDPVTKSAYARANQDKVLAVPEIKLSFDKTKNPKAGSHWCERAYADKHEEWQEKYQAAFSKEMNK